MKLGSIEVGAAVQSGLLSLGRQPDERQPLLQLLTVLWDLAVRLIAAVYPRRIPLAAAAPADAPDKSSEDQVQRG